MNFDIKTDQIAIGMDLGLYALAKLFATGKYSFTPAMWDKFAQEAAASLERSTGTPAEDISLLVVPILEASIRSVMGGK